MAEYNPSKIIKDGNTYNFRDTTKIPLAGSNEISGSLVPSTDGTVNLGSSSYQWNNAYIKSLTINGVVCGDILTHNVSEFVDITSAQTIGGVKTFASNMIIQGGKKVVCNLDNSFIELDGGTTWGKGGSIVLSGQDRGSYANSVLIVSKSDTNTDILQYQNGELKPHQNNTNNPSLGTSTNKWKSLNGIAPDELGLPTSTYTDVSSYITKFDSTQNTFTAPVSGLLFLGGARSDSTPEGAIFNHTKGYFINLPYAYYNIRGILPVEKGDTIGVYINSQLVTFIAKIFHLKGKV